MIGSLEMWKKRQEVKRCEREGNLVTQVDSEEGMCQREKGKGKHAGR